ncbi:hypothetical protein DAPPUDRAFT_117422 [Daphnia pulex]|uniref:Endonuclease/exonuclease/phosphatase domain-containing protein n=1 Tax=Daphnia pulex TaxID=6669 RepID=E9HSL1_DAPPU|nr:hypothetical protein DAPPUDRAFT_117422 [Daphnia pulex]|eukprot:EFX65269.1 hypothetical protein DAPPUDRAFT_117422 [Daphnia pulex]
MRRCVEVTFHNQLFALGLLKPRWSFRPEVIVVCMTLTRKKETQTTSIAFQITVFLYVLPLERVRELIQNFNNDTPPDTKRRSIYCPDGNANTKQDITDILNTTTNSYVIGGDLNAHSAVWEDDHQQSRCGKQIAEILLDDERITLCTPKNLGTRPNPNGKESSTIDLIFSSPDLANLTNINVGPLLGIKLKHKFYWPTLQQSLH